MRVLSADGVTVAVHDPGGRGDPPADMPCHRLLRPRLPALAAELGRHRHVWAVDLRGHGDSTAPLDGSFANSGRWDIETLRISMVVPPPGVAAGSGVVRTAADP